MRLAVLQRERAQDAREHPGALGLVHFVASDAMELYRGRLLCATASSEVLEHLSRCNHDNRPRVGAAPCPLSIMDCDQPEETALVICVLVGDPHTRQALHDLHSLAVTEKSLNVPKGALSCV